MYVVNLARQGPARVVTGTAHEVTAWGHAEIPERRTRIRVSTPVPARGRWRHL